MATSISLANRCAAAPVSETGVLRRMMQGIRMFKQRRRESFPGERFFTSGNINAARPVVEGMTNANNVNQPVSHQAKLRDERV